MTQTQAGSQLTFTYLCGKIREKGPVRFFRTALQRAMNAGLRRIPVIGQIHELKARVALLESLSMSVGAISANRYARNISFDVKACAFRNFDDSYYVYGPAFSRAFDYICGTMIKGNILEFGTFKGFTARCMAEMIAQRQYDGDMYLFDSFEGLPAMESSLADSTSYEVSANKFWLKGSMAVENDMPSKIHRSLSQFLAPERVHIVKGFFEDTLDKHLPKGKASLVHFDCDLYSSSKLVMDKLLERDLFQDGCVVLFDDFNCNHANPKMGQRRVLLEMLQSQQRWTCSPWFSYSWHGQAFFFHDNHVGMNVVPGPENHSK